MHIVVVGLNHRCAPIELRERLAFGPERLPETFGRLRHQMGISEAAILSTCNRVEIYAGVPQLDGAIDRLHRFLSEHAQIPLEGLSPLLYSLVEPNSVSHLFEVASGLDSMVLGEDEILHQVKRAYACAQEHGSTGKLFHALFQKALNAAKSVREHTAIGNGCTSVGTVAVELTEKIFGKLSGTTVALLGAGKIGEITLNRLMDRGVREVRLINRTFERAATLALNERIFPVALNDLDSQLLHVDVLISSASAQGYLLGHEKVSRVMRQRHQRSLCLVDLGVPRTIDPSVGNLENVYLFDIDDLEEAVSHYQRVRQAAVDMSRAILEQKVQGFLSWWQTQLPAVESGSYA